MLINWATFVFLKTLFVKNTIKLGVSADFSKKRDARFLMVTNWATLPFLKWRQGGPVSNH